MTGLKDALERGEDLSDIGFRPVVPPPPAPPAGPPVEEPQRRPRRKAEGVEPVGERVRRPARCFPPRRLRRSAVPHLRRCGRRGCRRRSSRGSIVARAETGVPKGRLVDEMLRFFFDEADEAVLRGVIDAAAAATQLLVAEVGE